MNVREPVQITVTEHISNCIRKIWAARASLSFDFGSHDVHTDTHPEKKTLEAFPFETVIGRHHLFAVDVCGTLWKLDNRHEPIKRLDTGKVAQYHLLLQGNVNIETSETNENWRITWCTSLSHCSVQLSTVPWLSDRSGWRGCRMVVVVGCLNAPATS